LRRPSLFRLALVPLIGLTTLEIALYHGVDFLDSEIVALSALGLGLLTFDLLTAIYVARSVPERRLRAGISLSALVWGLQLPVVIALVWIADGPPTPGDDSLLNVGLFGWWYTGVVSVPVIGLLSPCVGWIVDRRRKKQRPETSMT
jgi:hypothetical protein